MSDNESNSGSFHVNDNDDHLMDPINSEQLTENCISIITSQENCSVLSNNLTVDTSDNVISKNINTNHEIRTREESNLEVYMRQDNSPPDSGVFSANTSPAISEINVEANTETLESLNLRRDYREYCRAQVNNDAIGKQINNSNNEQNNNCAEASCMENINNISTVIASDGNYGNLLEEISILPSLITPIKSASKHQKKQNFQENSISSNCKTTLFKDDQLHEKTKFSTQRNCSFPKSKLVLQNMHPFWSKKLKWHSADPNLSWPEQLKLQEQNFVNWNCLCNSFKKLTFYGNEKPKKQLNSNSLFKAITGKGLLPSSNIRSTLAGNKNWCNNTHVFGDFSDKNQTTHNNFREGNFSFTNFRSRSFFSDESKLEGDFYHLKNCPNPNSFYQYRIPEFGELMQFQQCERRTVECSLTIKYRLLNNELNYPYCDEIMKLTLNHPIVNTFELKDSTVVVNSIYDLIVKMRKFADELEKLNDLSNNKTCERFQFHHRNEEFFSNRIPLDCRIREHSSNYTKCVRFNCKYCEEHACRNNVDDIHNFHLINERCNFKNDKSHMKYVGCSPGFFSAPCQVASHHWNQKTTYSPPKEKGNNLFLPTELAPSRVHYNIDENNHDLQQATTAQQSTSNVCNSENSIQTNISNNYSNQVNCELNHHNPSILQNDFNNFNDKVKDCTKDKILGTQEEFGYNLRSNSLTALDSIKTEKRMGEINITIDNTSPKKSLFEKKSLISRVSVLKSNEIDNGNHLGKSEVNVKSSSNIKNKGKFNKDTHNKDHNLDDESTSKENLTDCNHLDMIRSELSTSHTNNKPRKHKAKEKIAERGIVKDKGDRIIEKLNHSSVDALENINECSKDLNNLYMKNHDNTNENVVNNIVTVANICANKKDTKTKSNNKCKIRKVDKECSVTSTNRNNNNKKSPKKSECNSKLKEKHNILIRLKPNVNKTAIKETTHGVELRSSNNDKLSGIITTINNIMDEYKLVQPLSPLSNLDEVSENMVTNGNDMQTKSLITIQKESVTPKQQNYDQIGNVCTEVSDNLQTSTNFDFEESMKIVMTKEPECVGKTISSKALISQSNKSNISEVKIYSSNLNETENLNHYSSMSTGEANYSKVNETTITKANSVSYLYKGSVKFGSLNDVSSEKHVIQGVQESSNNKEENIECGSKIDSLDHLGDNTEEFKVSASSYSRYNIQISDQEDRGSSKDSEQRLPANPNLCNELLSTTIVDASLKSVEIPTDSSSNVEGTSDILNDNAFPPNHNEEDASEIINESQLIYTEVLNDIYCDNETQNLEVQCDKNEKFSHYDRKEDGYRLSKLYSAMTYKSDPEKCLSNVKSDIGTESSTITNHEVNNIYDCCEKGNQDIKITPNEISRNIETKTSNFFLGFYRDRIDTEEEKGIINIVQTPESIFESDCVGNNDNNTNLIDELFNIASQTEKRCEKRKLSMSDCNIKAKMPRIVTDDEVLQCRNDSAMRVALRYITNKAVKENNISKINEKVDEMEIVADDIVKRIKNLVTSFIATSNEKNDKMRAIINELSCLDMGKTSSVILETVVTDKVNVKLEIGKNNRFPSITAIQKRLLMLTITLAQFNDEFYDEILNSFEESQASLRDKTINIANGCKVICFYTLLCRTQGFLSRARSLLFDILYSRGNNACPVVLKMISVWPFIIPHASFSQDCLLTSVIVHTLLSFGTNKAYKTDLLELRKVLLTKYGYSLQDKQKYIRRNELFREILSRITESGSGLALILLSKFEDNAWTLKNVESVLVPILQNWIHNNSSDPRNDIVAAEITLVLGKIVRGLPKLSNRTLISNCIRIFELMLNKTTSYVIMEAVVEALLMLRRHNLLMCATVVAKWQPKGNAITTKTAELIRSILSVKPLNHWLRFLNHLNS